jgi:hypothetical protein
MNGSRADEFKAADLNLDAANPSERCLELLLGF